MGGFFGIASTQDCVAELFYGTDYHSHLGTKRGGLAVSSRAGITRIIHDISNAQFRSKFDSDLHKLRGTTGIGVISDYEDQPLLIGSHLGTYAIVTVGRINNSAELAARAFRMRATHFSEMSGGEINATELFATLINQEATFEDGIAHAQQQIDGSCSLLIMTPQGIYAARDRVGRTPVVIGRKAGAYAVSMESSAFPNLGYEVVRDLGPGEVVLITADGVEQKRPPGAVLRICAFFWVYFGYPSSCYEGINVEAARYACGAKVAEADTVDADVVAGIPDSGVGHAIGYANRRGVPYQRPFVKYTPTWPRSFMPQDQSVRDLVARMKLIPVRELICGRRILFCDDSIVRGTQLLDTIRRLYEVGAREVHMRVACPPLLYGCRFLNFSRSRSEMDLAARRAMAALEGRTDAPPEPYKCHGSAPYCAMVEHIRQRLHLTSLQYQRMDDLLAAIGLPAERVCTYCWTGNEPMETNG